MEWQNWTETYQPMEPEELTRRLREAAEKMTFQPPRLEPITWEEKIMAQFSWRPHMTLLDFYALWDLASRMQRGPQ